MNMTDEEGNELGKVFVGGLSQATTDNSLRYYFSQYGRVNDSVVMMDNKTGRSRGFGYIKFLNEFSVNEALESGPHLLDGKIVDVKQCNIHMKGRNRRSLKIFVGGIGLDDNEDSIRHFFSYYGNVTDVNLMLDQAKQRHRGFAFVGFDDELVVKELIMKHYVTMNGKCVEIKAMEPPNFARKLMMPSEPTAPNTNNMMQSSDMSGVVVCNSLPTEQAQPVESSYESGSDEKVVQVSQQPQYALQPIMWNNANQFWSQPYQFDPKLFNSNCLYSAQLQPQQTAQTANACQYPQYIPTNQPMWTMLAPAPPQQSTQPQQPPYPWGNYPIPVGANPIMQYSSVPTAAWPYNPYFLQMPQYNNEFTSANPNQSKMSSVIDPSVTSVDNKRNDEYWLYNSNNTKCATAQNNHGKELPKADQNAKDNEHFVRPNGDDIKKQPIQQVQFNSSITDFTFFQSSY